VVLAETIASRYHDACTTPSDIYQHLPTFVDIATKLDAKTVIELGTRGGVSTIAWLYAMEETDGHLWSVDIDPAPELTHDRWTFIQGNDLEPATVAKLPAQADIVFIDTSHLYEQTLSELNVYRWRVRPGGKILLHDTELRRPEGAPIFPAYPVKRAMTEFCNEEGLAFTNHPNCWGLGIVQL
jgi:predicted O-methyltransferase YrrM